MSFSLVHPYILTTDLKFQHNMQNLKSCLCVKCYSIPVGMGNQQLNVFKNVFFMSIKDLSIKLINQSQLGQL